jgi:hypothetical protein
MFGSEPRHPFWPELLAAMLDESDRAITTEDDILESTGPGLLTRLYHRVKDRYRDIILLGNDGRRCAQCGGTSCWFGPHACHHHLGSWRWQAAGRRREIL